MYTVCTLYVHCMYSPLNCPFTPLPLQASSTDKVSFSSLAVQKQGILQELIMHDIRQMSMTTLSLHIWYLAGDKLQTYGTRNSGVDSHGIHVCVVDTRGVGKAMTLTSIIHHTHDQVFPIFHTASDEKLEEAWG